MTPRLRFAVWSVAASLLLVGQLVWLLLLRGPRVLTSDAMLMGGQILLTFPVLLIALLLKTTPADAITLRRRTSEWIVLGGVALLQLAAVAQIRPALSEDLLRYRIDGRMWLSGVSPYATAPRDWPEADAIDSLAPFSHMRTIYPAVSQGTFATAAAIERAVTQPIDRIAPGTSNERSPWRRYLGSAPTPYRASVFRLIFAAAAVAMTAVMLRLLRAEGRSPWWAVLVAWNPLATLEIGGMGHQDVLGVLLVLLGLYALTTGRRATSGVCLALAVAVKPYAIFLLPFIPRRSAFAFIPVLLAAYLAPALYQSGHVGWRASARIYSQSWEANGSIYEVIQRTFGSGDEGRASERGKHMSRLLAAAIVLATALTAWRFRAAPATAGYWICL
ncbi:MAG: hypothetical protein QOE14_2041, partial [Humisphaera sp.]|nr:hypothetical protein [Humisphaera sp.]